MTQDIALSKQEQKTKGIVDAARAHFALHGFEATKLADVAKDAEVAVGTIYLRYDGKAELLAAVLQSVETSFCDAMDHPKIWNVGFPDRFPLIMKAVVGHALGEKDLGRLMALAAFADPAKEPASQTIPDMIGRHLSDGVARGELRADLNVPLASRLAHGLVESAIIGLMTDPTLKQKTVLDELVYASSNWLGSVENRD